MGEAGVDDFQEQKPRGNVGVRDTRTRLESKHRDRKQFVSTLSSFRVSTFITTQFFHQLVHSKKSFILLYETFFIGFFDIFYI